MLDDSKQLQLARLIPKGMSDLPEHLRYRRMIEMQQEQIARSGAKSKEKKQLCSKDLDGLIGTSWGVTEIDPRYVFRPQGGGRLIIIEVPLDYDRMLTAPSLESATEILRSYATAGQLVVELSKTLLRNGYDAVPHHPMGDVDQYHELLLPPHAARAGLGEKGRTGLFISYRYGSLVRLAGVTTNLQIGETGGSQQLRGITEFCHRCRYCVDHCPPKAIPDSSYMEVLQKGKTKDFGIDGRRCFAYFGAHNGCGRCLVHCILADPTKLERRIERVTNWYEKWVVSGELDKMYDNYLK